MKKKSIHQIILNVILWHQREIVINLLKKDYVDVWNIMIQMNVTMVKILFVCHGRRWIEGGERWSYKGFVDESGDGLLPFYYFWGVGKLRYDVLKYEDLLTYVYVGNIN